MFGRKLCKTLDWKEDTVDDQRIQSPMYSRFHIRCTRVDKLTRQRNGGMHVHDKWKCYEERKGEVQDVLGSRCRATRPACTAAAGAA